MNRIGFLLAVMVLVTAPAVAQNVGLDGPKNHRQIFAMGLYPPDIIMRHQQKLGITAEQRKKMLALVRDFQSDVAELQWTMQNEQQLMRQALAENSIDEKEALPRVERVLQMESQFKLAHFKLLIAVKSELTEDQIEMIQERIKKQKR